MEDKADQSGSTVVVGVSETEIRLSRLSSPSSQNAVTKFVNGLVGYEGLQVINSDGGMDDVHEWKLEVNHHPPMSAAHKGNEHFIYDITSKMISCLDSCVSMLITVVIYDRFIVKIMRKYTNNPRGVTLLQRMGIGIVIHIVVMTCAALTDTYRLHAAKKSGVVENGKEVPLTIMILLPQFILMGIADAVLEVAKIEFLYDQAPEGMRSFGTSFALTTNGIGGFLRSILLKSVSKVTSLNGRKGWILNNLNDSHIDYYYAFLAILSFLNFVFFLFMSKMYIYRAEITDSIQQPTEGREEPTT